MGVPLFDSILYMFYFARQKYNTVPITGILHSSL